MGLGNQGTETLHQMENFGLWARAAEQQDVSLAHVHLTMLNA